MAGTQFKYQKPPNSSLIINYMFWAFSDGFNPSPPLHPQPEPCLLLRKEAWQSQTCSAKSGVPQSSLRKYGQPHLTCCSLGPLRSSLRPRFSNLNAKESPGEPAETVSRPGAESDSGRWKGPHKPTALPGSQVRLCGSQCSGEEGRRGGGGAQERQRHPGHAKAAPDTHTHTHGF